MAIPPIAPIDALTQIVAPGQAGAPKQADFADWLASEGILSISLNPDSVVRTWQRLAAR